MKVECDSSIAVQNGFRDTNQSRYVFGNVLRFDCNAGYNLMGYAAIACQSTGIWNTSTLPTYTPVDCMNFSTPAHALVRYPNGTTFKSQAHIQCDPGFNISGSSVLICNETGKWEPAPPN